MSYNCPEFVRTPEPKLPGAPHTFGLHRRMKSNEDNLKSATLREPRRREGKVYPAELEASTWENDFSMSDASCIAVDTVYNSSSRPNQHQELVAQSQPSGGFAQARARSLRNPSPMLASTLAEGPREGFSSDEGELVAECFICLEAFNEDYSNLVPRNLQCGHAYCTSKPIWSSPALIALILID